MINGEREGRAARIVISERVARKRGRFASDPAEIEGITGIIMQSSTTAGRNVAGLQAGPETLLEL